MLDDERYMRRAIELAANSPALPFAAVVVDRRTGAVVAEGWNRAEEAARATARRGRIRGLHATADPTTAVWRRARQMTH